MITKSEINIGGAKLAIWKAPQGRSIHYTLQDGFEVIGEITLIVGYVYNNASDIERYVKYVEDHYNKTRDKMVYLGGFMIHGGHRQKGYGKSLLRHVLNDFKGYAFLLHAQPMGMGDDLLDRESLYKFYQNMGFGFIPIDSKGAPLMGNSND